MKYTDLAMRIVFTLGQDSIHLFNDSAIALRQRPWLLNHCIRNIQYGIRIAIILSPVRKVAIHVSKLS